MEKQKILCVDDEPLNLDLYEVMLAPHEYETVTAQDGHEALEKAREGDVALILLDIIMPGMDGLEVCGRLKADPLTRQIPVVMVTGITDHKMRMRGLESGASDFLTKPFDQAELLVRVRNLLRIKEFENFLRNHNRILADQVAEKTEELRDAYLDTIYRLTVAAEFKDEDTYSHIRRISIYTRRMAEELGLSDEVAETMFYASPMHDLGKIGIPDNILLKPGHLSPEEFEIMKCHTLFGGRILERGASPILKCGETFALSHHERWDGSGYPAGLRGEDIPLEGRILNLIDQYDALRSRRPYKLPLDHETVVRVITEGDGRTMPSHFDPRILEIFGDLQRDFNEIFVTNSSVPPSFVSG